jgi:hypothetical protein
MKPHHTLPKFNEQPDYLKNSLTNLRNWRDAIARELIAELTFDDPDNDDDSNDMVELVEEMLEGQYLESNTAQLTRYFGEGNDEYALALELFKFVCKRVIDLEIAAISRPIFAGFETVLPPPHS